MSPLLRHWRILDVITLADCARDVAEFVVDSTLPWAPRVSTVQLAHSARALQLGISQGALRDLIGGGHGS